MGKQIELIKQIEKTAEAVALAMLERKLLLATAESCTGGWIAQELTAIAGSSAWFDSGFVTYSNEAKQRMLAVPADLFLEDAPGAVSEATVKAMTAGAIANSRATVAVAVSGVAGPSGGSVEKPVGTVWIAWQKDNQVIANKFLFPGDRREVRQATVAKALDGILSILSS